MTPARILICTALAMWVLLSAVALPTPAQQVDSPGTLFQRANALYEGGDYVRAIELYRQLIELGVEEADLYYNLANACYKVDAIGQAVLNYERARRLSPRDGDTNENLSLVQSLLRDRQFLEEAGWLRRVVLWPHRNLSTRETFVLTSFWYLMLTLALLALIFRDSPFVSRLYAGLSIGSPGRLLGLDKAQDFALAASMALLLLCVTGVSAHSKYRSDSQRTHGIVLSEEVAVYSGPSDDSTLQFRIHEGTRVQIDGDRRGWVQVRFPGGLSGWIRSDTVDRI